MRTIFSYFSILVLFLYLFLNIKSEGGESVGLVHLALFFVVSIVVFLWKSLKLEVCIKTSFFVFLLFLSWLIFRWALDINDYYRLAQVTVATTGGIVTFYLVGAFFRQGVDEILGGAVKILRFSYLFYLSGFIVPFLFFVFWDRIRSDIFYLEGIDGAYQRPGNFLSIIYLAFSVCYLYFKYTVEIYNYSYCKSFFCLSFYVIISLLYLAFSQLIGSNSATGVILGSFFLVFVFSVSGPRGGVPLSDNPNFSNSSVIGLVGVHSFFYFVCLMLSVFFCFLFFVLFFEYQLSNLNIFGFSGGEISSLTSRIDLFLESGVEQLSHAPLFGNMNVSYIVTGESGKYIHSIFPYVLANLGLVGLLVFVALILLVVFSLIQGIYRIDVRCGHLRLFVIRRNICFLFLLLYLVFLANLSVEISWPVIWFFLGLIAKPLDHINFASKY